MAYAKPERQPSAASQQDEPVVFAFADFALASDERSFPPEARERATHAIIDGVGCQLAGSVQPLAEKLLSLVPAVGSPNAPFDRPLAGKALFASIRDAAFVNGAFGHALDFDDTNHPAYAHPTTVIAPALMALASRRTTGAELVSAHILGVEMFGKLGRALNMDHYRRGWHATSTFGALASALACSRLLNATRLQIANALGVAASAASGLRANFGSMTKPLHAGQAARAGVEAAMLAKEGFTAATDFFEHPLGYLAAFGSGNVAAEWLSRPGEPLEILTQYGLALKPFPSCGGTHPAIEAALCLRGRMAGRRPVQIRIDTAEVTFRPLLDRRPRTPLEAKFSIEFCVAAALADGNVTLDTFCDERLADPHINALMSLVECRIDEQLRYDSEFPVRLTIRLEDDEWLEAFVPLAKGKPERWMSDAERRDKFMHCATRALPAAQAAGLYESLTQLDGDMPVAEIAAGLIPRR